jgi:hypothetical protein
MRRSWYVTIFSISICSSNISKFRHCISSLDDWRTEDDLFKRDEFFEAIVSLLDNLDDEWVQDGGTSE